jgi:pSer/pThr/pTyr-binding forkhead associated (FHA) protein
MMTNPLSSTARLSSLLESSEEKELETRLGLYQVFLKIYKHHPTLLEDILQLENLSSQSLGNTAPAYMQAGVQDGQPYIITNLVEGRTQQLLQSQGIWMVGRDRRTHIPICEPCLSRHHAAIHYIHHEGFYLIDLNSTNGSFVNGEPVLQRQMLKDGDQIRLGSITITFFLCQTAQKLEPVPPEVLAQIQAITGSPTPALQTPASATTSEPFVTEDKSKETTFFGRLKRTKEAQPKASSLPQLSLSQQSEILDRFFSRQISAVQN